MNISLFFTRLGHQIQTLNACNTFRGTTAPARVALIQGDYTAAQPDAIAGLYPALVGLQNAGRSFPGYLRTLAQATLVEMVNAGNPQPTQSLSAALAYLIAAMNTASSTVSASTAATATAAAANAGNVGTGRVVATVLNAAGKNQQLAFAETVAVACVADSYVGGAAAGRETFRASGQYAVADPLSWLSPAGSGRQTPLTALSGPDGPGTGPTRNWLTNGGFEGVWTANTPANWTVQTGTPGTQILQSSSPYDGTYSLKFAGDGANQTAVHQQFASAGGTTTALPAQTQVAVNLWLATTGAPGSGVFEVALTDGSNAVLTDGAGNPCSATQALSGWGGTFLPFSAVFQTPYVLPAAARLRLRLSTALPAATALLMDRVALAQTTLLYPGGPAFAVFSGATPFQLGDGFTAAVTNDGAGLIQAGMDKLFNMRQQGLLLPNTTGAPTYSNSLIV